MTPCARVLGRRLDRLPPACAALHQDFGVWEGRISVQTSPFAPLRWLARMTGLPSAATDQPFLLHTESHGKGARWVREIGTQRIASVQWVASGELLAERMGPLCVMSELVVSDNGFQLKTRSVKAMGVPVPRVLWPRVTAREWQEDDLYRFDISVEFPILGARLVAYHGYLETLSCRPASAAASLDQTQ